MLVIPLVPEPAQRLKVILSNQDCEIILRQRTTGLFLDLYRAGVAVKLGILCRDRVALLRQEYYGFTGDLFFKDLQGASDPEYSRLGSRFILGYQTTI